MDTLPTEVVLHIVQSVDKHTLLSLRQVSHIFNTLTFPLIFAHIPLWLDYKKSHQAVLSLTHDLCNRPAIMWSAWASEPDEDVDDVWLGICWRVLARREVLPGGLVSGVDMEEGDGKVVLTSQNFKELSGLVDMCENTLRVGKNRFLMHRGYSRHCGTESFCVGGK